MLQETDGGEKGEEAAAAKPPQLGATVRCLVTAWQRCSPAAAAAHDDAIVDAVAYALRLGDLPMRLYP
jgi:hypothetical protein